MASKKFICKSITFYLIFYTFLGLFFSAMMAIFYQTIDDRVPKLQLDESLIGTNPGLGIRPLSPFMDNLIRYNRSDKRTMKYWVEELNNFLAPYTHVDENIQNCDNLKDPNVVDRVCQFTIDHKWAPCIQDHDYGFSENSGGPCIFLKLNKIFGWVPDCLDQSSFRNYRGSQWMTKMGQVDENQYIWVHCEGAYQADIENIGPIRYYPQPGFHKKYYPYTNRPGYLPPLVAVYFENVKRGILVHVECKAYANNIHNSRVDGTGSVEFYLLVD